MTLGPALHFCLLFLQAQMETQYQLMMVFHRRQGLREERSLNWSWWSYNLMPAPSTKCPKMYKNESRMPSMATPGWMDTSKSLVRSVSSFFLVTMYTLPGYFPQSTVFNFLYCWQGCNLKNLGISLLYSKIVFSQLSVAFKGTACPKTSKIWSQIVALSYKLKFTLI